MFKLLLTMIFANSFFMERW